MLQLAGTQSVRSRGWALDDVCEAYACGERNVVLEAGSGEVDDTGLMEAAVEALTKLPW